MTRPLPALTLLLALAADAAAQPEAAVQSANTPALIPYSAEEGPFHSTFGWRFTVGGTDLRVTQLGLLDGGSDGLLAAHEVGIWDAGGTLVTSATIRAGTASPIAGGYRYEAVAPATLAAGGTYQIGALFQGNNNDGIVTQSAQTFTSHLAFDHAVISPPGPGIGTLTNPTLVAAGLDQGVFGPNFVFVPVPEPGAVLGLSAVGLGLAGWARRKRAARASA